MVHTLNSTQRHLHHQKKNKIHSLQWNKALKMMRIMVMTDISQDGPCSLRFQKQERKQNAKKKKVCGRNEKIVEGISLIL